MRVRRRQAKRRTLILVVCGALLLLPAMGWAQDPAGVVAAPRADAIAGWLRSGDARVQAWGAVWALRKRDRSFLRELNEIAARWKPLFPESAGNADGDRPLRRLTADGADRRDVMAAVLDGVIQMEGELPADVVGRFAEDFPAQAVVLLARMSPGERTPVLRRMFREGSPVLRRSAASLLALTPPPGFTVELLRGTTVWEKVWVSTPGDTQMESGSGACCGMGTGEREAAGWPEVGQYRLLEPGKGDGIGFTLIVPGMRPIGVMRTMAAHDGGQWSGCDFGGLTDGTRWDLLAQMLGWTRTQMPGQAADQVHVAVSSEAEYERQLGTLITQRAETFVRLRRSLGVKGLLSADEIAEAELRPKLMLELVDARSEKNFELRQLPTRDAEWLKDGQPEPWQFQLANR